MARIYYRAILTGAQVFSDIASKVLRSQQAVGSRQCKRMMNEGETNRPWTINDGPEGREAAPVEGLRIPRSEKVERDKEGLKAKGKGDKNWQTAKGKRGKELRIKSNCEWPKISS